MKRLMMVVLLLVAGCAASPEYVEVRPECTVPPIPALPNVEAADLAPLPDSVFFDLKEREKRLVDWALEMEAMLGELCGDDPSAARSLVTPVQTVNDLQHDFTRQQGQNDGQVADYEIPYPVTSARKGEHLEQQEKRDYRDQEKDRGPEVLADSFHCGLHPSSKCTWTLPMVSRNHGALHSGQRGRMRSPSFGSGARESTDSKHLARIREPETRPRRTL